MNPFEYYTLAFKKFAQFTGRSRRKEFWWFVLFNFIVLIIAAGIDQVILGGRPILYGLYALASLVPNLALTVRRLHDTSRSGWWILISLVPLIGLVLIYFLASDSSPGENKWGPNPKEFHADDLADHLVE